MERNSEIRNLVEKVSDPEVLKTTLLALLDKVGALEARLGNLGASEKAESGRTQLIADKKERLDAVRHSLTELNERMERPYVVSAELEAVKEVLDVLAEAGDCNSIILEGEPGTGKTQWAYSEVGQELQEGKDVSLIHVRVKDTMRAQDLLYSLDDVRRLSDAQAHAQVPEQVRQEAQIWKGKILSGEIHPSTDENYKQFKAKMEAVTELAETAKDLDYLNYVDLGPLGEAIHQSGKGKRVYLVIDEIEKGREQLMTGILDEIENLQFTISETGTVVKGDKKNLRIVITTNTEDSDKIPPSFRRRSLYHFVDYPSRTDMAKIVELNFPNIQKELLNYAVSVFYQYHNHPDIEKKPSTPELLAWIRVLTKEFDGTIPDGVPHKEVLLKYQKDKDLEIGAINMEAAEQVEKSSGQLPNFVTKALQGEPIYSIDPQINDSYSQGNFSRYFAFLENEGVNYVTPHFEEKEERDNYGDWNTVKKNTRNFQIIIPGVEFLGNGFYVIPEDKLRFMQEIVRAKVDVLPAGQKFSSITEKNSNFTKGTVEVEGRDVEAYMVNEDGKVVITRPL